jgi:GLPGLI family protein
MKMTKSVCIFILSLVVLSSQAQITAAKITFERKTNLFKKFKDQDYKNWMKEEDKIKIDVFELYFNDTISVFKPQESELREKMEWATAKNTTYQNFNTGSKYMIKDFWGEPIHILDTVKKRKWKITESSRKIAGYNCRKAIWKVNDSTRIYAWFSYDLVTSTGPESFNGLPGTILGLATEDGGVIYFAKKVEVMTPAATVFVIPKKKKVYTNAELRAEMVRQWGKEKWFKKELDKFFSFW